MPPRKRHATRPSLRQPADTDILPPFEEAIRQAQARREAMEPKKASPFEMRNGKKVWNRRHLLRPPTRNPEELYFAYEKFSESRLTNIQVSLSPKERAIIDDFRAASGFNTRQWQQFLRHVIFDGLRLPMPNRKHNARQVQVDHPGFPRPGVWD